MALLLLWSLQRGWIVLGIHHREVVGGRDREIAARDKTIDALTSRGEKLDETIAIQARTISDKNAVEDVATRLLTVLHERQTT
ncbi:hypothetical protein H7J86_24680 [Mycobacterium hackensackense]|uniref:hypothetical protein n=1 Tax=Mycobacterium hackensackense TaxID=228909 RepID=UPI002265DFCE|nr:hypothetical protein [Mycobacterium hackensackense]MCV7255364.1 hypothetical protein [Mycobacterium hackensackense]